MYLPNFLPCNWRWVLNFFGSAKIKVWFCCKRKLKKGRWGCKVEKNEAECWMCEDRLEFELMYYVQEGERRSGVHVRGMGVWTLSTTLSCNLLEHHYHTFDSSQWILSFWKLLIREKNKNHGKNTCSWF